VRSEVTPRFPSSITAKRIITSGPHTRAMALEGSNGARATRLVTTPTLPRQPFEIEFGLTAFQFAPVKNVLRGTRAINKDDSSVFFPMRQQLIKRGAQWRQPDAASHDYYVASHAIRDRPTTSEWAADANRIPGVEPPHRLGHGTHCPGGVFERVFADGVAADGDRHFADTEYIQHVELAWRERKPARVVSRLDLQRESISRFVSQPQNAVGYGQQRIRRGPRCHLLFKGLRYIHPGVALWLPPAAR